MKKVKILYFVDRLLQGGIQSLVLDWISRIDKEKIQIDFLLLDDGNDYELEKVVKDLGSKVYKLEKLWIKKPTDYIKYAEMLNDFFKNHSDYKAVHLHSSSKNYLVLKYAEKHGIPIRIAHSHNIDFQTKNPFKKQIGNIFKRNIRKYATDYFACSKIAGEWLFGKNAVNSEKFRLVHNAVDYDKFKFDFKIRNEIRKKFNLSKETILYGNVGRFTNQKNHTFLIDIFSEIVKRNSNSKLILIGIGELESDIKKKVDEKKLNNKVIFAGFRKDVNHLMQAMDVFLLPSLHEGLPVVGVEAQAAGLPLFASKDVITDELKITKNLKFISLSKSASEWADSIVNSDITRNDSKKELKQAGYFIDDIVEELEEIYYLSKGKE